jgi:hypothetical protein
MTKSTILESVRNLRGARFSRFTARQGKQDGNDSPAEWKDGAGSVHLAVMVAGGYEYRHLSGAERAVIDSAGNVVAVISGYYRGDKGPGDYLSTLWKANGEETPESKAAHLATLESSSQDSALALRIKRLLLLGTDALLASLKEEGQPEPVAAWFVAQAVGALTDAQSDTLEDRNYEIEYATAGAA